MNSRPRGGLDGNTLIWCLWRVVKESLSPLKYIVIILIGFSTQAENQCIPSHCASFSGRPGEKQKAPSITIWPHCCSYSERRSLLESCIDRLNTWLWGISGINYFFQFKSPYSDWIFWIQILFGGNHGGDNEQVSRLLTGEVKVEMACKVALQHAENKKALLWNTQRGFELRPGFCEKL